MRIGVLLGPWIWIVLMPFVLDGFAMKFHISLILTYVIGLCLTKCLLDVKVLGLYASFSLSNKIKLKVAKLSDGRIDTSACIRRFCLVPEFHSEQGFLG